MKNDSYMVGVWIASTICVAVDTVDVDVGNFDDVDSIEGVEVEVLSTTWYLWGLVSPCVCDDCTSCCSWFINLIGCVISATPPSGGEGESDKDNDEDSGGCGWGCGGNDPSRKAIGSLCLIKNNNNNKNHKNCIK